VSEVGLTLRECKDENKVLASHQLTPGGAETPVVTRCDMFSDGGENRGIVAERGRE
jgi:hypothetical protein